MMNENTMTTETTDRTEPYSEMPEIPELKDDTYYESLIDNYKTPDMDTFKYTKIDCLDEDRIDPSYNGPKYFLIQFVSPEGLMNCNVRGFKIKGGYKTEDEAKKACAEFIKQDGMFDIFIAEMGLWYPWDPSLDKVKRIIYDNKKLDKMMAKVHEKEQQNIQVLNEMVGTHKANMKKSKQAHKQRIKESLQNSIASMDNNTTTDNVESSIDTTEPVNDSNKPKTGKPKNRKNVRERLRKQLQDREEARRREEQELKQKKELTSQEVNRIGQKENTVKALEQTSNELKEKLERAKRQYAMMKEQQEKENQA